MPPRAANKPRLNGPRKIREVPSARNLLDEFAVVRRRRVQPPQMATDSECELKKCSSKSNEKDLFGEKSFLAAKESAVVARDAKKTIIFRPEIPSPKKRSLSPSREVSSPKTTKVSCGAVTSRLMSKAKVVSDQEFLRQKKELIERYKKIRERPIPELATPHPPAKAYERYSDLVRRRHHQATGTAAAATNDELPLPPTYLLLLTLFKRIDMVLSFQYIRQREILFKDVQLAVARMSPRMRLKLSHLAMIRRMFSSAYRFGLHEVDLQTKSVEGDSVTSDGQRRHLTLTFGFQGTQDFFRTKSRSIGSDAGAGEDADFTDDRMEILLRNAETAFAPGFLARRSEIFAELLLHETRRLHGIFLEERGIANQSIRVLRWHPEFSLRDVPYPEQAEMPEIQNHEITSKGMKMFELAKTITKMRTNRKSLAASVGDDGFSPVRSSTPINSDIPEDVVRSVELREAKKKLVETWKSTEQYHLLKLKKRLPSVALSVFNAFESKSARVLHYEYLESQAMLRNPDVSQAAFADLVEIVLKEFETWIYLIELRNGQRYLKLKTTMTRSEFKKMVNEWIRVFNASVKEHPEFSCCPTPGI